MSESLVDLAVFTINPNKLCEQRTFTDFTCGEVIVNVPVTAEGLLDESRSQTYLGRTKLNAGGQIMPIQFVIDADSFPDAIEKFPHCVAEVVKQLHSQAIRQEIAKPARNSQLDLSRLKS